MKIINPNSKRAFVNLFSDFVLQKLGKSSKTIVQVTLFNNFIIVNGKTDSEVNFDLMEIKNEFIEKNSDLIKKIDIDKNLGTLDLIEKTSDFFKNNCFRYHLDLYNTKRPLYHKNVIDFVFNDNHDTVDWRYGIFFEIPHNSLLPVHNFKFSPLQVTSEFPYGYSLSIGRSLLYYAEYISYNIFNTISVDNFKMLITNQKNLDGEPIIDVISKSPFPGEKIKSLILDNFDFDLEKFHTLFDEYNFADEILNLTAEKPWLVKNIIPQDLFIF